MIESRPGSMFHIAIETPKTVSSNKIVVKPIVANAVWKSASKA